MHNDDYFGNDLEDMSHADNYYRWILELFAPYIGDTVVEVGAGSGNFSQRLLEQFPIKHHIAIEPSRNMFSQLKKNLAPYPNSRQINSTLPKQKKVTPQPDTMIYINVLEHIEDDRKEIAAAYKNLSKNGHLLVYVPALPWLYGRIDSLVGHYRRYTKKDLETKLESSGFVPVISRYSDAFGILPWFIMFKMLKSGTLKTSARVYDSTVIPVQTRIERFISPPIGKNLLIVGKK